MTPSRAVLIFQESGVRNQGSGVRGQESGKEALPWWIFGMLGMLSLAWAPDLVGGALGLPGLTPEEDDLELPAWQFWGLKALYFAPGMLVGLLIGWFAIGPVNVVLAGMFRGFNIAFDRLTDIYGWTIAKALRLSVIVLLAYGGLLFLTYFVFRDSPRGFVPQQDMGRLVVSVQLPDSAGLERTQEALAQVDDIMRKVPGVAHTIGLSGISFVEATNGSNFGSFFVILDPFSKRQNRELRADGIMAEMRKRFADVVKEARVVVSPSSPVPGISTSGGFKIVVQDGGGLGLPTLQDQTDKFVRQVKEQIGEGATGGKDERRGQAAFLGGGTGGPMLAGVSTQFRSNTPQLYMEIDRIKAASMGVPFDEVSQALQIYLGSFNVNRFNAFGRYWHVTLQADRQFRDRIEDINQLQVRNSQGQMVPLGTLVSVREKSGPIFVRRYNLYTAAPITGALLPGVSSGEVIATVDQISHESLQRSMRTEWTELMYLQIREGNTTAIVFALAVVCVFLALAALYESWALPLAVILVVPLCMLCSIVGILLAGTSVNIFVQIGLVVLVGLACKNAILIVEFARELHQQGKPVFEATLEASRLRLRPILMTSFAFILGVVPLCVASGAGAEMRRSLGIAVFSGMVGVTAFGIFLTPIFFYVIQGLGETRLFAGVLVQWVGSALIGGLVGAAIGYLLGRLGIVHALWGPIVGATLGIPIVLAFRGVHLKLLSKGP
ncbi:MAG: efflux RND transporter permease subunit [Gemmataceae bacterium]|nr:efflux RND transporter permease subunit [Gemmataceae bacterium]